MHITNQGQTGILRTCVVVMKLFHFDRRGNWGWKRL